MVVGSSVFDTGKSVGAEIGAKVSGLTLFVGRVGSKVGKVGKAVGSLEGLKEAGGVSGGMGA
jgi:hypothetical protein